MKSNAINNSAKDNLAKGKKTNILRVLPSISSRLSKSVLVKLKFFKKNSVANSTSKSSKQSYYHKLHSACISTTSELIFTN